MGINYPDMQYKIQINIYVKLRFISDDITDDSELDNHNFMPVLR